MASAQPPTCVSAHSTGAAASLAALSSATRSGVSASIAAANVPGEKSAVTTPSPCSRTSAAMSGPAPDVRLGAVPDAGGTRFSVWSGAAAVAEQLGEPLRPLPGLSA